MQEFVIVYHVYITSDRFDLNYNTKLRLNFHFDSNQNATISKLICYVSDRYFPGVDIKRCDLQENRFCLNLQIM